MRFFKNRLFWDADHESWRGWFIAVNTIILAPIAIAAWLYHEATGKGDWGR